MVHAVTIPLACTAVHKLNRRLIAFGQQVRQPQGLNSQLSPLESEEGLMVYSRPDP